MHIPVKPSLLARLMAGLFILPYCALAGAETLKINTGFTPPVSHLLQEIMQATFKKAGIGLVFNQQPAERSIALASRGIDDGDCCRIPRAIAQDYPDLVQVPELVYTARFSAFAKRPLPKIDGFESLKPYSVASVSGWKILVNNLHKIEPETLHILDNAKSMFQVLDLDRIDIATYGYLSGLETLSKLGLANIAPIEPPLASAPLYLYLNRKHAHLAPRLARTLKTLKEDGSLRRIIQSYER